MRDGVTLGCDLSLPARGGAVEPDVPTDYRIAIRPQHYRFAAGHRFRLRVSGGPSHALVPPDAPVEVTVHLGPGSALRLPGFAARD